MKNLLTLLLIFSCVSIFTAQAPMGINYQAVARDSENSPMGDVQINVGIIIRNSSGLELYSETHHPTTNAMGLFTLKLGQGENAPVPFSSIDWGSGEKLLEVIVNGSSGGTQPILSVPYALYSEKTKLTAGNSGISVDGNTIYNTGDVSNTNELQTLDINGNQLSISNGNVVTLPSSSSLWSQSDDDIYYENGKVGIGTADTNSLAILNIRGRTSHSDADGVMKTLQGVSSTGNGYFGVRQSQEGGFLSYMGVSSTGNHGYITTRNLNGNQLVGISAGMNNGAGDIRNYHPNGLDLASMGSVNAVDGGGFIGAKGFNGKENCFISSLLGYTNHGYVSVFGPGGWPNDNRAGMYVNQTGLGVVFADIKNFKMIHPTQAGKEIWYASIEGPEAAAYLRGTGKLEAGESTVEFPDHFQHVINPSTMTVVLTPLSGDSKGLAVIAKTSDGFSVKELFNGNGDYGFDWEVKAVRKGFEDYQVVRDEEDSRPAPPNR
jgi:hypothetical protein